MANNQTADQAGSKRAMDPRYRIPKKAPARDDVQPEHDQEVRALKLKQSTPLAPSQPLPPGWLCLPVPAAVPPGQKNFTAGQNSPSLYAKSQPKAAASCRKLPQAAASCRKQPQAALAPLAPLAEPAT